ncbi:MAG: hypothetical protein AAF754_10110 [Pseudomonadota bacterium]
MPHAEIKYARDVALDAQALLAKIETVLQAHDPGSGDCKGRAYAADHAHHDHVIVNVSMLPKSHRDAAFMRAVRQDLFDVISAHLPRPIWLSLHVGFSGPDYMTEELV